MKAYEVMPSCAGIGRTELYEDEVSVRTRESEYDSGCGSTKCGATGSHSWWCLRKQACVFISKNFYVMCAQRPTFIDGSEMPFYVARHDKGAYKVLDEVKAKTNQKVLYFITKENKEYTEMVNNKKKPMFHTPEKTGIIRKIPTAIPTRILSIVSLVLLAALLGFAIYAASQHSTERVALSAQFEISAGLLYLFLPVLALLIALGFRMAVRFIPLEMWRLPNNVKKATIRTSGRYLKVCTLLIELETVLSFAYITWTLYQGHAPADLPIIIWVAAVAATIIFFGRLVLVKNSQL